MNLENTVSVLTAIGFIMLAVQLVVMFAPFTRKLYSRLSAFVVGKLMRLPRYKSLNFNFHYSSLNRYHLQKVYHEIIKEDTRSVLTIREFFQIIRTVTKVAEDNNVLPRELFSAIEHIDGRGNLTISEVAKLLDSEISIKEITEKTRKGYSFFQIMETKGVPVDWTDAIYDKGFKSNNNPFYGF